MNIEWWMIDGIVCLIVLAAALRGAVKGISDTVLRIAGLVGGSVLAVMFSKKLSAYLSGTSMSTSLHDHIFTLLRGDEAAAGAAGETGSDSALIQSINGQDGSILSMLSKSLVGIFDSAADKAADAAAERLTEVAVSIIAFSLIIIGVSLTITVIRILIKKGRKSSVVLGFTDRTLGFVLGVVRGLLLAWVAVALLVPVTALLSPESVPGMMSAIQQTEVARVIYDVNPLMFLVKRLLTTGV